MKPVQASAFIFSIVCGLSAGCERKGEPIPQGTPTPETPITPTRPVVPHINPAKPDMETDRVRTGTTLEGDPAAIAPSKDEQRQAKAKFKVVAGSKMSGDAKLTEDANGVKVVIELDDGPPGKKGIHVHEKGNCSDIPGKSMGEHFAPDVKTHGLPASAAHHLGDLGNIQIAKDGDAHLEITAQHANLKENDPLSFIGRAIVIHESDDKGSQPSGGSGKPIACAVIEKD